MLPERLLLGALLLAALVMITGCATTAKSEDDYETLWRNASDECIRFGHATGSDGYSNCMVKRLGSGKEISVAGGDTKQTSPEIPPPPTPAELSASDANETGQVSAKGELEIDESGLKRLPTLPVTPYKPVPGIDGTWTGVAIGLLGEAHKLTFTFKANGNTLRGTAKGVHPLWGLTTAPLENGRITGNSFSFTLSGDLYAVGAPVTFIYNGLFLGDALRISWIVKGGNYYRNNVFVPYYRGRGQAFIARRVR